jgi:gamma-glutamyltranspeptidase/glutathione hydrolase
MRLGIRVLPFAITLAILGTGAALPGARAQGLYERVMLTADNSGQTMKPLALGTRYAVTSIMPQAALAAQHILEAGGNAYDAAVAGQAVLGVVQPENSGLGGDAVLLVYDAKDKKVWSINAEGTAPKLATIDWYMRNSHGRIPSTGLLSATVPGMVDAWTILLSRWGTKSLADVLEPALELAENGFPLAPAEAAVLNGIAQSKNPTSAKLYRPPGIGWRTGDIFKNLDLARTFRRLIEAEKAAVGQGRLAGLKAARDRFYRGDIARELSNFSEANGGLIRYGDLASYAAEVGEPVSFNYHGYVVHKNPSASQGPAELFALSLLSGYDLKRMGLNSADYIHTSVEAVKLAMADRDKYLGDTDFIRIPYRGLLSAAYAQERRKLIDPGHASLALRPGEAERFEPGFGPLTPPSDYTIAGNADHSGDTSFVGVVDGQRNAVAFTPSLYGSFGDKVVMGDLGFILNNRGCYFSLIPGHANALAPGKRPRSTLQATLVTKDAGLFMITGCPGGDYQAINTMQTFLNLVDFGLNVQQAIEAPRWATRAFPSSATPHGMFPGDLQVESRLPEAVRADLARRGHKVWVQGPYSIGMNAAIVSDAATGVLSAGADPRVTAVAIAW